MAKDDRVVISLIYSVVKCPHVPATTYICTLFDTFYFLVLAIFQVSGSGEYYEHAKKHQISIQQKKK
jgi:hypothetical protein